MRMLREEVQETQQETRRETAGKTSNYCLWVGSGEPKQTYNFGEIFCSFYTVQEKFHVK